MKEEEPNSGGWFPRWEEQLPSPEELTPLSQTLITPDLAAAFDIPGHAPPRPPPRPEFEASEVVGGGGSDEQARTLKRPRLVWTPQLHKRFVDAVAQLGIKNAVPKTIMQLMSVDGLTRENVASHLQKYRLYLKRMQGISSAASAHHHHHHHDAATDHLFASGPLLRPPPPDPFPPFSPIAALHHHYYHQRTMTHLVPGPDHPLRPLPLSPAAGPDDCSPGRSGERKVLTLFPTND